MGRKRFRGRPDWAQGKEVLWDVLTELGEDEPDIGFLEFIDTGLFFSGLYTEVELGGESTQVVVRVPRWDVGEEQPEAARREIAVRRKLADIDLPFAVPRPLGCADSDHGLAIVDQWVPGASLGKKTIQACVDPVEITAVVAAGCHAVDPEAFRPLLSGPATRRGHAESALGVLEKRDLPEFDDALQWAREHLPPTTPSRLLHGDLLGQNILITIDLRDRDHWSASVIDWHAVAIGDPAYDLAIVSRGHRKVFCDGQPLEQLVDTYNERADEAIDIAHVRIYELWLKARHYLAEYRDGGETAHTEQLLRNFRTLLRRCV